MKSNNKLPLGQIDLINLSMGSNWSPGRVCNTEFITIATGGLRATNAFVDGAVIEWYLIQDATAHFSSFYTGVVSQDDNTLRVTHPKVKKILYGSCVPDETTSEMGVTLGPSVSFEAMNIEGFRRDPSAGTVLTGNADGSWTGSSVIATNYAGFSDIRLNDSKIEDVKPNQVNVTYQGTNNYRVRRIYSGFVAPDFLRFELRDNATNTVVTSLTTADVVSITGLGSTNYQFLLGKYKADHNAIIAQGNANFIAMGIYELFLIAKGINKDTVHIKWQEHSDATNYRITRSTDDFVTNNVVIYTGTDLNFIDEGLTSNTLYYYKLEKEVASVYSDVTTYIASTI